MTCETCEINTIEFTRGDSKSFKFQRHYVGGDPILEEADAIYLTVKQSWNTRDFVFQKRKEDMTFDDDGYYHVQIFDTDTENLRYGKYAYDIEVIVGAYKKTVAKGYLILTNEATFKENE